MRNKEQYRREKKRSSENVIVIDKKPLSDTLRGAPISFCSCNRKIVNLHRCGLQDDKWCANVKDLLGKCARLSSEWQMKAASVEDESPDRRALKHPPPVETLFFMWWQKIIPPLQ